MCGERRLVVFRAGACESSSERNPVFGCRAAPGLCGAKLRTVIGRFRLNPTVSVRAPAKSYSNAYPAFERFRYFRRGARWFERTGLKPAGLRFRRGGAPKGRFTGHSGEKTPTKHPTGATGGRCLPALGIGLTGEKANKSDTRYYLSSRKPQLSCAKRYRPAAARSVQRGRKTKRVTFYAKGYSLCFFCSVGPAFCKYPSPDRITNYSSTNVIGTFT